MNLIKRISQKKLCVFCFSFVAFLSLNVCGLVQAEGQGVVDTLEETEVILFKGDLASLKVYTLTRIAISDTDTVDIANAEINKVLIVGKKAGVTQIFIWDEHGKRKITVRVFEEDLEITKARMEAMLEAANIKGISLKVNKYEQKIVATGKLLRDEKETLDEIFEKYGDSLFSLVREEGDMILIDVQVSELSTTLTKALGFDWTSQNTSTGISLPYQETLPTFDGSLKDLFKIGDFGRTEYITATVNALIQEGKARILSKPSIIVADGEEAKFLVGGEIPVITTTISDTGTSQENVTFKEYGVDLAVTPQIKSGKIDLTLNIEIRDIDASNAVGNNVAFTSRTADTKLLLDDGQTIVIAGLIKHSESERTRRVPFLSSIPVVGLLFRNSETVTPTTDTEVVISLTPHIYKRERDLSGEKFDEDGSWADGGEETQGEENILSPDIQERLADIVGEEREAVDWSEEWAAQDKDVLEEEGTIQDEDFYSQESEDEGIVFSDQGGADGNLARKFWDEPTPEWDTEEDLTAEEIRDAGWGSEIGEEETDESFFERDIFDQQDLDAMGEETGQGEIEDEPFRRSIQEERIGSLFDEVDIPDSSGAGKKDGVLFSEEGWGGEDGWAEDLSAPEGEQEMTKPLEDSKKEEGRREVDLTEQSVVVSDENDILSDAIGTYVKAIQALFSKHISFPSEARGTGWIGTVKITLIILNNGNLNEISVKEPSGYNVFDKDAISTAHILAPFEPFPPELDLEALVLTIPIIYKEGIASGFPEIIQKSPGEEEVSRAITDYVKAIQRRIAATISFPYEARAQGWEGTVVLSLTLLSDGILNNVVIRKSSGYSILDTDAVTTTQSVAPFAPFSPEIQMEELVVTIPIVYSQKGL